MNVLVLFCHPTRDSFQGSILAAVEAALGGAGHAVRVVDLYAEGFDPVLDAGAWRAHRHDQAWPAADLAPHLASLAWAEGLVLVFPTWWYGLPALLKGWFDRVWQPGAAFTLEDGMFQTNHLTRLGRFAVVTTHGSPGWFIRWIVGDPARKQLTRGLALQFARGVKTCWAPIYGVDGKAPAVLARARDRAVGRAMRLFR